MGGEALGPGVSDPGRARPARGSAWGWGGGSVHWRALQHHLGRPCSPSAPGAELVHFLAFLVALEGDRDRPGLGASPEGPEHPAECVLSLSHASHIFIHTDTHRPTCSLSLTHNAPTTHPHPRAHPHADALPATHALTRSSSQSCGRSHPFHARPGE